MMSEIPKVSDRAVTPGSNAMADEVPRLALRALGRSFGDEVAVDDLNLEIAKGEFISLLGPSGCGKTTTLRMIAGFIQPSAGVIEMDREIIASAKRSLPPEKRGMVMIFQSYALWPHKTVAENVAFGLRLRKLGNAAIRHRVTEMLQAVKLDSLAGRYPAELSGGQQQRVALARAIVVEPAVLLLDEPLSNLDANLREEMRVEIRRLHNKFKMTTILVTHDQAEAMATSDRIAIMNKGKLEQVDTPLALYAWPKTRFVANFIGRTNFLEARCDDTDVVFDGFSIAREQFGPRGLEFSGHVTFSLRTAKYWHWAAASGQRDAARGDISAHAGDSARSRVFRRILGICRDARGWGSALARRLPTERNLRRWPGGPVERRSTTNGAGRLIG